MGQVAVLAAKELDFVHLLYCHESLSVLDGSVVESYWLQRKYFKCQEGTVVSQYQMVTSSRKERLLYLDLHRFARRNR